MRVTLSPQLLLSLVAPVIGVSCLYVWHMHQLMMPMHEFVDTFDARMELHMRPLELQAEALTQFADNFDQTMDLALQPMMLQLDRIDIELSKLSTHLEPHSSHLGPLALEPEVAMAVGLTLLGVGAGWWLWQLGEEARGRR
jgi:hypothetical protein